MQEENSLFRANTTVPILVITTEKKEDQVEQFTTVERFISFVSGAADTLYYCCEKNTYKSF